MLGMAPGKMAQAASEIPEGRTLSVVDVSGVTVASSWTDEGKYDADFYSKIEREYDDGYATAETALEIGTAEQFAAFAKVVDSGKDFEDKFVCLTDDIDLQGVAPTVDYQNDGDEGFKVVITGEVNNNWVPIGDLGKTFYGTFDGRNHSILGMVEKSESYGGLFGFTHSATIQNVGVKDSFIINTGYSTGKIVGYAYKTTIQNCYATGTIYICISGKTGVGGIVGYCYSKTIKNCYNSGDIFVMSTNSSYGVGCAGICEDNERTSIKNCLSTSKFYAYSSTDKSCVVKGLVANTCTISDSYYDKEVAGDIGAVYGQSDTETVKGITTAEFKQKLIEMVDENGNEMWFLDSGIPDLKKMPRSSDFTFTLPDDLDYDGQGKTITIAPKAGITGMGTVTVKYYKVENGSTTLLDGPPTDAGRYKVKFDVASGTEYYSAKDLPAMF